MIQRRKISRYKANLNAADQCEYLTAEQKYFLDVQNLPKNTVLHDVYLSIYNEKFKTTYPNIQDFWAWLWTNKTFLAYVSYNVKNNWLSGELVQDYKTGLSNAVKPIPSDCVTLPPPNGNGNGGTDNTTKYLIIGGLVLAGIYLQQ